MGRAYGNLAASIGSTRKLFTSSILIIFNSSKDYIVRMFQASRASRGWEAVNNHMCSCRSLNKPVRQARKSSEGFELKHSYYAQETY